MTIKPGLDTLVANQLSVLVMAPGGHHDEHPGLEDFAAAHINDLGPFAEIHLYRSPGVNSRTVVTRGVLAARVRTYRLTEAFPTSMPI